MTRIEQRIESIASALSEFVGGSFHFIPRGHQLTPALIAAPITGVTIDRLAALPITALVQAVEAQPQPQLQYRISRTIQTIPEL